MMFSPMVVSEKGYVYSIKLCISKHYKKSNSGKSKNSRKWNESRELMLRFSGLGKCGREYTMYFRITVALFDYGGRFFQENSQIFMHLFPRLLFHFVLYRFTVWSVVACSVFRMDLIDVPDDAGFSSFCEWTSHEHFFNNFLSYFSYRLQTSQFAEWSGHTSGNAFHQQGDILHPSSEY